MGRGKPTSLSFFLLHLSGGRWGLLSSGENLHNASSSLFLCLDSGLAFLHLVRGAKLPSPQNCQIVGGRRASRPEIKHAATLQSRWQSGGAKPGRRLSLSRSLAALWIPPKFSFNLAVLWPPPPPPPPPTTCKACRIACCRAAGGGAGEVA